MSTITIKINEKSKAGKTLKELIAIFSKEPGVEIVQEKSPYNQKFVEKIRRAEKQKGKVIDTNDVWGSLGLK
jgi:hypothetical protein